MNGETINQDLPCMSCQYNLRGMSAQGRCPECASPVDKSVVHERLKNAEGGALVLLLSDKALRTWQFAAWVGLLSVIAGPVATAVLEARGIKMSYFPMSPAATAGSVSVALQWWCFWKLLANPAARWGWMKIMGRLLVALSLAYTAVNVYYAIPRWLKSYGIVFYLIFMNESAAITVRVVCGSGIFLTATVLWRLRVRSGSILVALAAIGNLYFYWIEIRHSGIAGPLYLTEPMTGGPVPWTGNLWSTMALGSWEHASMLFSRLSGERLSVVYPSIISSVSLMALGFQIGRLRVLRRRHRENVIT